MHEGSLTDPHLLRLGSRGEIRGEIRHKILFKLTLVDAAAATRSRRLNRQKSGWKKLSHPEANSIPQNFVMPFFGTSDTLSKIYSELPIFF